MSEITAQEHFEMLEAGRALGDLTPEEEAEWQRLAPEFSDQLGEDGFLSFDELVTALETSLSPDSELPAGLSKKVQQEAKPFQSNAPSTVIQGCERHPT